MSPISAENTQRIVTADGNGIMPNNSVNNNMQEVVAELQKANKHLNTLEIASVNTEKNTKDTKIALANNEGTVV